MAEIPIEKKTPLWPWLLALAAAVVAGLLLYEALDDDEYEETAMVGDDYEVEETYVVEEAEMDTTAAVVTEPSGNVGADHDGLTGAVTTVAVLENVRAGALDGKPLRIDDMKVTRVVGDKTFYVSPPTSDREFFVILDEERTPNTAIEGRYDVTAGQTVDIRGSVEDASDVNPSNFQLTEQEARAMRDDTIFLRADSLNIES